MEETVTSNKRITKDTVIIFMGLFYPALHNYIWRVLVGITRMVGVSFSIGVFDAVVWTFVILLMLLTAKRLAIQPKTLFFYLLFLATAAISYAVTSYVYFTPLVFAGLIISTISFFLLGSCVRLERVSHRQLYKVAVFTLLVSILYSFYSIGTKELNLEDNMEFAYNILPSVLVIISWLFTDQKKKLAVVFTVVGIIFLMLQGTRGPLLCLAVFVCLMLYKKYGIGKTMLGIGAVAVAGALLLGSQSVKLKLLDISKEIDSTGFSSRFITMVINDEISDSNGRDAIKDKLTADIKESPLEIRGLFADRQATRGLTDRQYSTVYKEGTYAHSLWLEMVYDYGVLLGGALLLILAYLVLRMILHCTGQNAYIVMLFICTGFVHLFLSGSYLESKSFFFLLGLSSGFGLVKRVRYTNLQPVKE